MAENLSILAVEDDPIYAETLEMVLLELGYTNITITDNATSALKLFKEKDPDILLADIDINGPMNGIELASIIGAIKNIPTVFLTSFTDNETFCKAKETKPAAYIVKPYHATNLQAAIELAVEKQNYQEQPAATSSAPTALFVKYNSRLFKILVDDIIFIEVDEKYCHIHTANKKFAVNMRLKNLVDQLPPNMFMQIHRSYAVRLNAIEEINTDEHTIRIKGTEIPIGKTFREPFFNKLVMI